jgi:DNA-directed RNA polymerase specialized sigma24 family protein
MFALEPEVLEALNDLRSENVALQEDALGRLYELLQEELISFVERQLYGIVAVSSTDAFTDGLIQFGKAVRDEGYDPDDPMKLLYKIVRRRAINLYAAERSRGLYKNLPIEARDDCDGGSDQSPVIGDVKYGDKELTSADEADNAEFLGALRDRAEEFDPVEKKVALMMIDYSDGMPFISPNEIHKLSFLYDQPKEKLTLVDAKAAHRKVIREFKKVCIRFGRATE